MELYTRAADQIDLTVRDVRRWPAPRSPWSNPKPKIPLPNASSLRSAAWPGRRRPWPSTCRPPEILPMKHMALKAAKEASTLLRSTRS